MHQVGDVAFTVASTEHHLEDVSTVEEARECRHARRRELVHQPVHELARLPTRARAVAEPGRPQRLGVGRPIRGRQRGEEQAQLEGGVAVKDVLVR